MVLLPIDNKVVSGLSQALLFATEESPNSALKLTVRSPISKIAENRHHRQHRAVKPESIDKESYN